MIRHNGAVAKAITHRKQIDSNREPPWNGQNIQLLGGWSLKLVLSIETAALSSKKLQTQTQEYTTN